MAGTFHRANLRGSDFKGKDLSGADFSYADIRGADFRQTKLIGANFNNTKAGLSPFWLVGLAVLALALSLLSGLIAGYAGALTSNLLYGDTPALSLFGFISVVTLIAFLTITLWRGLGSTLATLAELTSACLIAAIAFFPEDQSGYSLVIGAQFTALSLAGVMASVGNMSIAVAIARVMALPGAVAFIGFTALIGIGLGTLLGVREASAFLMTGSIAIVVVATGIYIGLQAIAGAKKYWLIRTLSMIIVTQRGTSFRGADLTDANFTEAILKTTDFRQSILTRTCWFQAQRLDQARVEETYLENPDVQQLVTSKEGREKTFDRLDLRGVNLKDANLQDASFIGADLSQATLENANLLGAKLVQTQLYSTNLTTACLTGAYIQNWGISIDTQFNGVKCEYIYMQLPTKDDPDPYRKPDNRNEIFKDGDFADFITPIIKTLDLYRTQNIDLRQMAGTFKTLDLFHHQGIDPTAAAIALQQLIEEHPEAGLEVIALEGRGNEKIRLQAVVTGNANRSELSTEYFVRYRQIKSLPYPDLQTLLAGISEKDERISSLEKLLENALQQPKFYVETYQNQGEFSMSQSKGNVNISGVQGNVSGIGVAGENQTITGSAIGAVSGSVINTINQLPASSDLANPGIKELLIQLQEEIEAESELADEDKVEALEQVKTLAEAGQQPEDSALQKTAKTAMKILKGTVSSLPDTAKLADACAKLLPIISKLLLLG